MEVLKLLVNALPWILRIGTLLGKDPVYKYRAKKKIGSWYLTELSAADRQQFADMTNHILKKENDDWLNQYTNMKYQVIAACVRNKRGYFVFDPMNRKHLDIIASFPESMLVKCLEVIAEQSGMPWLVPQEGVEASSVQGVADTGDKVVQSGVVDWEGNGDQSEQVEKPETGINP